MGEFHDDTTQEDEENKVEDDSSVEEDDDFLLKPVFPPSSSLKSTSATTTTTLTTTTTTTTTTPKKEETMNQPVAGSNETVLKDIDDPDLIVVVFRKSTAYPCLRLTSTTGLCKSTLEDLTEEGCVSESGTLKPNDKHAFLHLMGPGKRMPVVLATSANVLTFEKAMTEGNLKVAKRSSLNKGKKECKEGFEEAQMLFDQARLKKAHALKEEQSDTVNTIEVVAEKEPSGLHVTTGECPPELHLFPGLQLQYQPNNMLKVEVEVICVTEDHKVYLSEGSMLSRTDYVALLGAPFLFQFSQYVDRDDGRVTYTVGGDRESNFGKRLRVLEAEGKEMFPDFNVEL